MADRGADANVAPAFAIAIGMCLMNDIQLSKSTIVYRKRIKGREKLSLPSSSLIRNFSTLFGKNFSDIYNGRRNRAHNRRSRTILHVYNPFIC